MRRAVLLVMVLAVVAVGLLVGDGLARNLTEQRVAAQIERAENLPDPPDVSIDDRFFLLSAALGEFERVTVTSTSAPVEGLTFSDLTARLSGVQVPVREALSGRMPAVRAAEVRVQARLDYPTLTTLLRNRVETATGAGNVQIQDLLVAAGPQGTVRVTGRIDLLGVGVRIDVPLAVDLADDRLVLTASPEGTGAAAEAASRIDARIDVPPLPYGLTVDSVTPGPGGLELLATGSDVAVNG